MNLSLVEDLHGRRRRLDGVEVGVGETARPARRAVHGDADVLDALEVGKEVVHVLVRCLERDVADVDGRCGRAVVDALSGRSVVVASSAPFPGGPSCVCVARLGYDAAAVPEGSVDVLGSLFHRLRGLEVDKAVAEREKIHRLAPDRLREGTLPILAEREPEPSRRDKEDTKPEAASGDLGY